MDVEEWLRNNREKIIKIIDLEDIQSKSDPCEQPYKSQYFARDILHDCISDLDMAMSTNKEGNSYLAYFVYFNLSYRLANNFISTEERFPGEEIIFSLCQKIEEIKELSSFLNNLNKISPIGDQAKPYGNSNTLLNRDIDNQIWLQWLAGLILRIYNACGMLWASRIASSLSTDSSPFDDPGSNNSLKYLTRAKRIYKNYKHQMQMNDKTPIEVHTEITFNYNPPECFDSLLLSMFLYQTPYLVNECYLHEGVDRKEALKFDIFESDYTTTLFLLAQTFGKMSNRNQMKHKSAKYCYWTLYRQLNAFKYDPVEWAINAATLSQYYVVEGVFKRARHCIAASETILKEAICRPTIGPKEQVENLKNVNEKHSLKNPVNEEKDMNYNEKPDGAIADCNKTTDAILEESIETVVEQLSLDGNSSKDTFQESQKEITEPFSKQESGKESELRRKLLPDPMSESRLWDDDVYEEKRVQGEADIDRCWISYGLNLLELSFDRKLSDYSGPNEMDKFNIEAKLPDFNLELAAIERKVTYEWVHVYEDARELFLFVQRKINSAREYYKLDFRCSDAIDLICDHSKAFKAISNFETSIDRKCVMHKKRIDMLTELLKTLNQKYYLIQCRKMMLEIGEIYSTMMNLKLSLLETTSGSDDSIKLPANAKGIVQKIRLLGKKGLSVYESFLDSYRTSNNVMPEVFTEEDIRPVLIAHFYMARMYSKVLEPDANARLKNLVKSLEHYQYIVNYCDKHDNAAGQMNSELDSCRDMTVLLPRKIDKLRCEI